MPSLGEEKFTVVDVPTNSQRFNKHYTTNKGVSYGAVPYLLCRYEKLHELTLLVLPKCACYPCSPAKHLLNWWLDKYSLSKSMSSKIVPGKLESSTDTSSSLFITKQLMVAIAIQL